jgi:hypothetical protein
VRHPFNPFDYCALALRQQALLAASVQTIWWRTGCLMAGTTTPAEAFAMCTEKPVAFAKAMDRGARAAVRGQSPARILSAALEPISRKASSNARRRGR